MSISDKLIKINQIKQDIRSALSDNGISVTQSFGTYPSRLRSAKTGKTLYVSKNGPSGGSNGDLWFKIE